MSKAIILLPYCVHDSKDVMVSVICQRQLFFRLKLYNGIDQKKKNKIKSRNKLEEKVIKKRNPIGLFIYLIRGGKIEHSWKIIAKRRHLNNDLLVIFTFSLIVTRIKREKKHTIH